MKIQLARHRIRFSFFPTLAFLCLLPLLIALGFWQLGRAEEKTDMLVKQTARQAEQKTLLVTDVNQSIEDLQYRSILLNGHYDIRHQFLLDNQIVAGRAGYFVYTPFIDEQSDKAVLVNRGWVVLNKDRSILPDIGFIQQDAEISGRINHFPSIGLKLEGAEIPSAGWPAVVQVVNTKVLEKKLGYELFDFQLQLNNQQENGYWREWKTHVSMPPEKHFAYAMQWFGLAIALVILYFVYGFKYERRK